MLRPTTWGSILGAVLMISAGTPADDTNTPGARADYPAAKKGDTVDDYHGTKVADPYRWLEEIDSADTRAWIEAENKVAERYFSSIPARDALKARLTQLWDYEKFTTPNERGGRYFYGHNTGLQNQNVLFSTQNIGEPGKVLLDPNTLSSDGTVALAGMSVTKNGKLMAYALAEAGSDWTAWKVREIETGKDRDDLIKWSKFSGAEWTPDAAGFFYNRFPEPKEGDDLKAANYFAKLYYHKLGTPQSDDKLIWKDDEHKDWRAGASITDDGKYLVYTITRGTDDKYRILWRPLAEAGAEPKHLVGNFDYDYTLIDNDGPWLYFRTNEDAARNRVVAINVDNPDRANWKEILPESADTLDSVHRIGDKLIATFLKDAHSQVKVFDLSGKLEREVELAGLGTVGGFGGDRDSKDTYYSFTSFARPTTIYRYDLATGESSIWKSPSLAFNPDDYATSQVFYNSKDGTRVPMFVTHKKSLKLSADTPCLLYAYGGFNIPLTPGYSPANLVWMEQGGIYAVANLRGGGEYGEDWHQGGTKLRKQNVFDDFIAAAEWLVEHKYTSTPKLAILGGSNGGLLVGACLTQRPDLYGAAVPAVGVLDMLRFQKFTIGWAWTDDYGSSDDPEQFKAIHAYSPLHNIKLGTCYPPTLVMTADHDDRVFPAHSFKFAAALQAAQSCDNPVLIRIETRAGHGAGKPTSKLIEEAADRLAFLVKELKVPAPAAN